MFLCELKLLSSSPETIMNKHVLVLWTLPFPEIIHVQLGQTGQQEKKYANTCLMKDASLLCLK